MFKFNYTGFVGCESVCGIQIIECDEWTVVIATELDENKGTSITNFVEFIVPEIAAKFNLDASKLVWVEHYPSPEETWDIVRFIGENFSSPVWKRIQESDVESICLGDNPLGCSCLCVSKYKPANSEL